jgi:hypothetical protein
MPRIVLGVLAAATLFLLPAVAQGDSGARVRGAIASKNAARHLVSVRSPRQIAALRVPGSLVSIRIGQQVELRGSTLRAGTRGSRVLARNVTVLGTRTLGASRPSTQGSDDEVEITGTLTSLSPVTVQSGDRTVACASPAGMSLTGFAVGDVVEMTCDLQANALVVRELKLEDDQANAPKADDDDNDASSGPGNADDENDDSGGPGSSEDDGGDNSGRGGGDDG